MTDQVSAVFREQQMSEALREISAVLFYPLPSRAGRATMDLAGLRAVLQVADKSASVAKITEHAFWLVESYKRVTNRLQACVQRHGLGLGGEDTDRLVCEKLDELLAARQQAVPLTDGQHDGVSLIAIERRRQVEFEGWDADHDDGHDHGELAIVAALLAVDGTDARVTSLDDELPDWAYTLTEKHRNSRVLQLTIAGALIAAEIDRALRFGHSPAARQQAVPADRPQERWDENLDRIDALLWELHDAATHWNPREYGLPISERRDNLRGIVTKYFGVPTDSAAVWEIAHDAARCIRRILSLLPQAESRTLLDARTSEEVQS